MRDVLLTDIDRCYDRQPQIRRILKWIEETYAVKGEYLWNDHPDDVVFRHPENRRWFAMILSVSRQKLYFCMERSKPTPRIPPGAIANSD